jgi:hypothetical protein
MQLLSSAQHPVFRVALRHFEVGQHCTDRHVGSLSR